MSNLPKYIVDKIDAVYRIWDTELHEYVGGESTPAEFLSREEAESYIKILSK